MTAYRFRTMCADYKEAADALVAWEQATTEGSRSSQGLPAAGRRTGRDILSELLEHDS